MVRFIVKRYAPRTFDYQWAVVDIEENKRIGRYKTKNLAESACFEFNIYNPEAEQFLKDKIIDVYKPDLSKGVNATTPNEYIKYPEDDPLPEPKRHSNKRLISLN